MIKTAKRVSALLICIAFCTSLPSYAAQRESVRDAAADTAVVLIKQVMSPKPSMTGGDWTVFALARGGFDAPDGYFETYYSAACQAAAATGGVLHPRKYTENARAVIALSAIGIDARDIAGFDLTLPLGDFSGTLRQGVNGAIYALLALDSGAYPIPSAPDGEVQATRRMYIDEILRRQLPSGGFSLTADPDKATFSAEKPEPDMTAMALQALAAYASDPTVAEAIARATLCLSGMQQDDGSYTNFLGQKSAESSAQTIVAMCRLGIGFDDARFVKNGRTALDALMDYYVPGKGFSHDPDGSTVNLMTSEQCFYALVAAIRVENGQSALYDLGDITIAPGAQAGLRGRHADIIPASVTAAAATFDDISSSPARVAIEALAKRGIITGRTAAVFDPDSAVTRAELAALTMRAFGLLPDGAAVFDDVPPSAWFSGYVSAAARYGIIRGRSQALFDPMSGVTFQEAAIIMANAAKLVGIDISVTDEQLSALNRRDGAATAPWAKDAMAYCAESGIIGADGGDLAPRAAITRADSAGMLHTLLAAALLLGK